MLEVQAFFIIINYWYDKWLLISKKNDMSDEFIRQTNKNLLPK